MKRLFTVLGIISGVMAVIFAVLPISNLSFFPAISAIVFSLLGWFSSSKDDTLRKTIQYVFLITLIALSISTYKMFFVTSEVTNNQELQDKEKEFEEDAIEELEDLELDDITIEG